MLAEKRRGERLIVRLTGPSLLGLNARQLIEIELAGLQGLFGSPRGLSLRSSLCLRFCLSLGARRSFGSRLRLGFRLALGRLLRKSPQPLFFRLPLPLDLGSCSPLGVIEAIERHLAPQPLLFQHIGLQPLDTTPLALEGAQRESW